MIKAKYRNFIKKNSAFIMLLIVLVVGFSYFLLGEQEKTDNAYVKTDIMTIRSRVSGYVEAVFVKDNQYVKNGEVIAEIESRDYEAKLKKSEAELEIIKNQIELQEYVIKEAEADLSAAKATFERSKKDLRRTENLVKSGTSASNLLDRAVEEHKNALASLDSRNAKLLASKKQLDILKSQYEEFTAALELAKIDFENTKIIAKSDGYIGKLNLQPGQLITPQISLGYLIDPSNIRIEANFKESQVSKMKPGQKVTIKIDALKGQKFYGKIDSISPATGAEFSILPPENATGNFTKIVQRLPVKIIFDEGQDISAIKPGMSSYVVVDLR